MSDFITGFEAINTMVENPGERHISCVILADTSGSMAGAAISELNQGLKEFGTALSQDEHARGVADVCVISFDTDVKIAAPFCPASEYTAPVLTAGGLTSMNQAIIEGLDEIEKRKELYRSLGCAYYRPWLFLLTDGMPTDRELEAEAKRRLHQAIANKKINFFPMGIGEGVNYSHLKSYIRDGKGVILKASADNFKEAFIWLSSSMSIVSTSNPDDKAVPLPNPPESIMIELI